MTKEKADTYQMNMNKDNVQINNDIPELQSPFEQLREVDAYGKEWWNSRKLSRIMGYGKYWNFERVMAKAQAWISQKGYHLDEHFVEFIEMAELGSGEIHLSDGYKKYLNASDKWSDNVTMYNLDVVIAVGYRVNSYEATQFHRSHLSQTSRRKSFDGIRKIQSHSRQRNHERL